MVYLMGEASHICDKQAADSSKAQVSAIGKHSTAGIPRYDRCDRYDRSQESR